MKRVYSYNPKAHMGQTAASQSHYRKYTAIHNCRDMKYAALIFIMYQLYQTVNKHSGQRKKASFFL